MLKITDLRKQYGKVTALDGVDLQVNQGETVVVMGPSGCGKSTLIRCINRLTEPDGGSIQFAGVDVLQLENGELQRSEEHTSELQSRPHLVCRLLLEKKKKN